MFLRTPVKVNDPSPSQDVFESSDSMSSLRYDSYDSPNSELVTLCDRDPGRNVNVGPGVTNDVISISAELPKSPADAVAKIFEDASSIITCVTESRTVTSANKKKILELAKSIMESSQVITFARAQPPVIEITETTTNSLRQTIREEITNAIRTSALPINLTPRISYADVTKSAPRLPVRHTSKPSIIVESKKGAKTKDEVLQDWRNSISFRNTNYAPAKIHAISNNKLRVEFDNAQQQEETLCKLSAPDCKVTAVLAKRLRPMVELKGLYVETDANEVIDMVKSQNEPIKSLINNDDDIILKFQRKNKNDRLYNVVLMVTPPIYKKMLDLSTINIDHQRVQVIEFVPLLQCFKCLQFGHTRKRCENDKLACSHCGADEHTFNNCALKSKTPPNCFNCSEHNRKYRTSKSTDHGATSKFCSIHIQMNNKIIEKTDYGY